MVTRNESLSKTAKVISSLSRLQKVILDSLDFSEVVQNVVDGILYELGYLRQGYRIVVLALVDEKSKKLKRISVSQTDEARRAVEELPIPFKSLDIPLRATDNLCIRVLREKKPMVTHRWPEILTPPLTPKEATVLQRSIGIETSMVYPVIAHDKAIGIMIFSMVKDVEDVSDEERVVLTNFTDVVGLAVQNARLYSTLAEASEKVKRANRRLRQIDKLKDEFISIASHELRTPLTAIKGYLWMALNKASKKLPDDVSHNLNVCYTSTERLIRLVQEMLTVSRIQSKRLEVHPLPFNYTDMIFSAYEELKMQASEKQLHFTLNLPDDPIEITGDKDKLKEVFLNLVGNAIKFTPVQGTVAIRVYQEKGIIKTSIQDTGPGIRDADREYLFTKFGKLDFAYSKQTTNSGTGLGLYVSKEIVDLHKGKIEVESVVGKGSIFTIQLPKQ